LEVYVVEQVKFYLLSTSSQHRGMWELQVA